MDTDEKGLVKSNAGTVATARTFLEPIVEVQQLMKRYNAVNSVVKDILKEGQDYGSVPGIDKPALLKPGAEKLCTFFGLVPRFELLDKIEDWSGRINRGEPFFYYRYRCVLYAGDAIIADGEGSCNSMEVKYRYRWVPEDQIPAGTDKASLHVKAAKDFQFKFAIDKAETSGKYGRPQAYWDMWRKAIKDKKAVAAKKKTRRGDQPGYEIDSTLYRVPNPDIADQVNTFQKMAQKRAFIGPVLIATNTSERFTQDVEDFAVAAATEAEYTVVDDGEAQTSAQSEGDKKESGEQKESEPKNTTGGKPIVNGNLPPTRQQIIGVCTIIGKGRLEDQKITDTLDWGGRHFTKQDFSDMMGRLTQLGGEDRELPVEIKDAIKNIKDVWIREAAQMEKDRKAQEKGAAK